MTMRNTKIIITRTQKAPEKHYSVPTVARAIGRSENSIYAWASNHEPAISVRGGLTLDQIAEAALYGKRGESIVWTDIPEIQERLEKEKGILITEEEIPEQLRTKTD